MKRIVYIASFAFLGLLISFLIHAGIEIWYIGLLLSDFERWGFGLSWDAWEMIHSVGAVTLASGGVFFGYTQGRYWWRVIYIERRLGRKFPFLRRFNL